MWIVSVWIVVVWIVVEKIGGWRFAGKLADDDEREGLRMEAGIGPGQSKMGM